MYCDLQENDFTIYLDLRQNDLELFTAIQFGRFQSLEDYTERWSYVAGFGRAFNPMSESLIKVFTL